MPDAPQELKGKVAVITGVGSGFGRATSLRFAQAGAKVVGADIDAATGKKTIEEIRAAGGDATFLQVDVSNESQVKGMIDTAMDLHGRLDILYNNAGIMPLHASIEETPFEVWKKVIAVDLDSVFLGCKYGVPAMKKSGGGRIMNTASLAGIRGFAWGLHYCAAKGGVVQLTIGLAELVEPDGIKVNAICPTGAATNLSKTTAVTLDRQNDPNVMPTMASRRGKRVRRPGMLKAEDIARAAYFLATKADFTGGAVLIELKEDLSPDYYVAFEYKWERLKEEIGD